MGQPLSTHTHAHTDPWEAGKPIDQQWVFHGTAPEKVHSICAEGFKVGGEGGVAITNGAVHGHGVYTAKGPKTPMGYLSLPRTG